MDAAAERQAAFEAELTQEVARRSAAVDALEAKLRDAADEAAADRAAAGIRDGVGSRATRRGEATGRGQGGRDRRGDERAAGPVRRRGCDAGSRRTTSCQGYRQAAMDAAAERKATFETALAEEVARRQTLATRLSALESASAQAEQRHHLAMAAASAQLEDERQQANRDRQAASDAAVQRQAEYDTQLAAEVTERQLLANQLAHRGRGTPAGRAAARVCDERGSHATRRGGRVRPRPRLPRPSRRIERAAAHARRHRRDADSCRTAGRGGPAGRQSMLPPGARRHLKRN